MDYSSLLRAKLAERKLLVEKLYRLRRALAIEDDPSRIHKYEVQIKEVEDRLRCLDIEIDSDPSRRLYKALVALDYWKQTLKLRSFIDVCPQKAGAFLIEGSSRNKHGLGEIWLMKRLIQEIPNGNAVEPIYLDLSSRYPYKTLEAIWGNLCRGIGFAKLNPLDREIARQVCLCCTERHIIMVFLCLDHMDQGFYHSLIEDFWKVLVDELPPCNPGKLPDYRVIMFMVDHAGKSKEWDAVRIDQIDESWTPDKPVRIPGVKRFSSTTLKEWMKTFSIAFPYDIIQNIPETVQYILR